MMTNLLPPYTALLLGGFTTWLVIKLLITRFRGQILDNPNARSSHQTPTPSSGGIGFVLSATCLAPLSGTGPLAWLPLICFPLAMVGLWDDRVNLSAWPRFIAQIMTALAIVLGAHQLIPAWLWGPVMIVIVGIINFINFTDGLDGLVALCLTIFFSTAVLKNMLITGLFSDPSVSSFWPLIGGLVSFLLWNWSPAKIFMGDVGSTFLGGMVSGTVLDQASAAGGLALLLVAFPLLGDAGSCLLRRIARRDRVFAAHRLHLFQRLHQAGWPHKKVAIIYGIGTSMLGVACIYGGLKPVLLVSSFIVGFGYWLDQYVAVPFDKVGN